LAFSSFLLVRMSFVFKSTSLFLVMGVARVMCVRFSGRPCVVLGVLSVVGAAAAGMRGLMMIVGGSSGSTMDLRNICLGLATGGGVGAVAGGAVTWTCVAWTSGAWT